MRANRRSDGRVPGELGSYFLAQLLRRMNSAPPLAVRTPAQELFLIWCWPPCQGLCIIFQGVFSCILICFSTADRGGSAAGDPPPFNYFQDMLNEPQRGIRAGSLWINRGKYSPRCFIPGARVALRWSGGAFIFVPWGPDLLSTIALFCLLP